jgi:hypothetical protein
MPAKLSGDRKLLIAIAIVVPLLFGIAAFFAPDDDLSSADVSTYSARSGGAKATFEFLQELGFTVQRWTKPAGEINDPEGRLLIVSLPQHSTTKEEADALTKFVDDGGVLLTTGYLRGELLPQDRFAFDMATNAWREYPAGPPQPMNRGVRAITMPRQMHWKLHPDDTALFADGKDAVAVTVTHGKGRVIWLASHVPLCNAGLKAAGNPEFLANILQVIKPRDVYWYAEPETTSAKGSALVSPPALASAAQVLFIFALVLWTYGRRFGPIHAPVENTTPMAQLEFVHTLGNLYEHANATNIAVDIAYRRFVFLAARHFALAHDDMLVQHLSSAVARALSIPDNEVAALLEKCEQAVHTPNLPRQEAAEYMNKLREYLVGLRLIQMDQEK